MLPARYILVGACRWLDLLKTSTRQQAQQILKASPEYADLTLAHYVDAYEWIVERGLTDGLSSGIPSAVRVLEAALAAEESGLGDFAAETLPSPGFLPVPVIEASRWLDIPDTEAWRIAISTSYKIDLERRSRIGELGERALVELLSAAGCHVYHGSVDSDALGWDIAASDGDITKHIEVKSTTSRSRLRIYLSRHEYEVSVVDPDWLLAFVLITDGGLMERFGYVHAQALRRVVPVDRPGAGRWQMCSIDLQRIELSIGLPFNCARLPKDGILNHGDEPIWWPTT